MKVRAVVSFTSMVNGEMQPWPVGHEAELPAGVNWLELGWVVRVDEAAPSAPNAEVESEPDKPAAARRPAKKKSVSDGQ